jgi:putative heme iron utilization protein
MASTVFAGFDICTNKNITMAWLAAIAANMNILAKFSIVLAYWPGLRKL